MVFSTWLLGSLSRRAQLARGARQAAGLLSLADLGDSSGGAGPISLTLSTAGYLLKLWRGNLARSRLFAGSLGA